ncbi:hypothetical protein SS50377_26226 [Spironucleus salmonicida]|uniref:Transmembrane protein n=1 Tax=Spironucleus salmonicida TaxID=348837 RepID=V6LWE4_9EUKA|nr:hypothetical protein SS50377_26226 [Spironucleus salmonicida]|eukprot:EST48031.1 Hypothetical protein SS50377_11839 [Spironucleus salmonicida]
MLLIILQDQIHCFDEDSSLIGRLQRSQFYLHLSPTKNQTLHCLAFNNTVSIATLHYVQDGAVQSLSTDFTYQSGIPLEITFNDVKMAQFNFMTELSIISYEIVLGKELSVPGTFSLIQHTMVNTSNCWNNVTLVYNRSRNSYLSINAEPNDCQISTPAVEFQYQVDSTWISIPIAPNSSSPATYYKLPFVHLDTHNYQIFAETSSADIQQSLLSFFKQFQKDRQLKMRLSLNYTQSGSSLSQQIFGEVIQIQTDTNNCITDLNLITIVTSTAIQNIADLSSLKTCISSSFIMATSVFQKTQQVRQEATNGFAERTGIVFFFDVENMSLLTQNLTGQTQQLFISFYDANQEIISEQTIEYAPIQSCFYKIITQVSFKDTCIIVFPTLTPECLDKYKDGVLTQQQEVLQMTSDTQSRIQFQVYKKRLVIQNKSFFTECFSEADTIEHSQFPFFPGDYHVRQKGFIQELKKSFITRIFITNEYDYQLSLNVIVDQKSIILIYFWVIISLITIVAVVATSVLALRQQ